MAQLESQRIFYEEKMNALESSLAAQAKAKQQESNSRIALLQESVNDLVCKLEAEEKHSNRKIKALEAKIDALRKEKAELVRQRGNDDAVCLRSLTM